MLFMQTEPTQSHSAKSTWISMVNIQAIAEQINTQSIRYWIELNVMDRTNHGRFDWITSPFEMASSVTISIITSLLPPYHFISFDIIAPFSPLPLLKHFFLLIHFKHNWMNPLCSWMKAIANIENFKRVKEQNENENANGIAFSILSNCCTHQIFTFIFSLCHFYAQLAFFTAQLKRIVYGKVWHQKNIY